MFHKLRLSQSGFTAIEVLLACVIFPIIVVGIANSFESVSKVYSTAKQLNEVYAVLSACPELDRALDFSSLSAGTNCFPNNTFAAEGGGTRTVTYTPTLTVTDTTALPAADPLKTVVDSKVVDIKVNFIRGTGAPLELRMLITRNGIAQQ